MIEYIKVLILAIFTGMTAPLPASSAAHFSFMNAVMDLSTDETLLGFYYSVFMVVFSFVVLFALRKIYINAFKAFFRKSNNKTDVAYKSRQKNIFISIIPVAILFIPVSSDMLLCDWMDKFLNSGNLLLSAVGSIISGLILIIAIWYTKKGTNAKKRGAKTKDVIRMSVYSTVCHIVPGMSKVSACATNLLVCDTDPGVISREVFLYLAPQVLVFNLIKIIRTVICGLIIDPIPLIIGIIAVGLSSALIISLTGKVNMKKLYAFFSVYAVVFGLFIGIVSFII